MSTPAITFSERYQQMRGTPTPPGSSNEVEVVAAPVVVELAEAGDKPVAEGNRTAAPDSPQATEATAGEPAADDKAPAPRGGFQKTISDLTAKNQELARQLEETKAALRPPVPPAPAAPAPAAAAATQGSPAPQGDPEPEEANFKTYAEYLGALSKWNVRTELRETREREAQAKVNETLKQRFDAAAAKHADFHEVAKRQIPVNDATQQILLESEHAGDLFYYLATNEAVAREIAGLSPLQSLRRLDTILKTFEPAAAPASQPPAPRAQVSSAPRPLTTVKASTTPSEPATHEVKTMKDFTALRAKQGQRDAKRLMARG